MALINEHFLKLKQGFFFPEITRRIKAHTVDPEKPLLNLGIGDVSFPLPKAVISAFHQAVDEMADSSTFRGYGPEVGYAFLRKAIAQHDFQSRDIDISEDEIFVSDGTKGDTAHILDIFSPECKVAVTDPVYPVYLDASVMTGYTGPADEAGFYEGLHYLTANKENNFKPSPPDVPVDLIYLCSPNNPTGTVFTHSDLTNWVEYAKENQSIILYDAAYEAFVGEGNPRSIYEIPGAKEVAVEFRSFSKTVGFTGTRCAYSILPKELVAYKQDKSPIKVYDLWYRRQTTKLNGLSYPIQKAAAASFTEEAQTEIKSNLQSYLQNAKVLKSSLAELGFETYGGDHSPYIWFPIKEVEKSFDFFDLLLKELGIIGTPGSGFGRAGEGYFRFSAFCTKEAATAAVERLTTRYG